jgi:hypothetical protein
VLSSLVVRERRPVELIIMKSSEETKVGGVIHKITRQNWVAECLVVRCRQRSAERWYALGNFIGPQTVLDLNGLIHHLAPRTHHPLKNKREQSSTQHQQ